MGRGSYVGDALMGLRMLGGLLSVPAVNAAQENADWQAQRLMAQAQGQSPPEQPEPSFFSSNNTGALGGIMSGVGGLGQVMAALSGAPVRAPRLDLGEQVSALQYGRQLKADQQKQAAMDVFTNPDARKLAELGQGDAAAKMQFGDSGNPNLNRWIDLVNDETTDPKVREKARRNIAEWERVNGAIAGRRAAATMPFQIGVGAANDNRDAGIRADERDKKRGRGQGFIAPFLDGSAPAFQRQGGPSLLSDEPGRLKQAAFDPIADQQPRTPSGLVPTGGSISSEGDATVNLGLPEKVTAETEILARSLGLDLRNLSQQDAQLLISKQRDLDANRRQREEEVKRQNATLNDNDRQVVSGMFVVHDLLRKTQTDFTPEERTRYVGLLNQPLAQVKQLMRNDPRFAEWGALLGQIQAAKFDFAGKNLTKTENDIINSFIPTGSEYGGQGEFDKKVGRYLEQIPVAIQAKLTTAGPISAVQERVDQMQSDSNPKAQFDSLLQQYGY